MKIARVDDVPSGQTRYYTIEDKPVLLANVHGEIVATHGLSPHRLNPLDGATLLDYLLDCPWHHFQYDLRTGENQLPSNVYPAGLPVLKVQVGPLRTYPVEIRDGEVWADLE